MRGSEVAIEQLRIIYQWRVKYEMLDFGIEKRILAGLG